MTEPFFDACVYTIIFISFSKLLSCSIKAGVSQRGARGAQALVKL